MKVSIIVSLISFLLFFGMSQAESVEPLSTKELSSHCSNFSKTQISKDAIFCIRYIQGFIDGAVATDERVVSNLSGDQEREETFSERAIRTRVGNIKRYGSTYYADFCLADSPLREVVNKVIGNLNNKVFKEKLARNAVFKTLRMHYPCKKSK